MSGRFFLTGVLWAGLVEACLLEGRFVEGLLGLPGGSWGLLGLAGASSWGLLGSWELLGLLGVSWGFPAGSRRVSWCFLRHPGASWSLWFVLVFSRRGFWRALASSCRPFGGCLRPVAAWAGARVRSSFGRASRVGQSLPAMKKKCHGELTYRPPPEGRWVSLRTKRGRWVSLRIVCRRLSGSACATGPGLA